MYICLKENDKFTSNRYLDNRYHADFIYHGYIKRMDILTIYKLPHHYIFIQNQYE